MATEAVQPLRISKMTPTNSPSKLPRPLSELGSTERRRNSPSYNQATKKMIVSRESSPYETTSTSPFRSPRPFWDKESMSPSRFGSENSPEREVSPTSAKRSSIENLKKASRVANSPMFARETKDKYDPSSSPMIPERPLTDRPLSDRIQQNPFARYDSVRKENNPFKSPVHRRTESKTDMTEATQMLPSTMNFLRTKELAEPKKSSLTASSRYAQVPPAFDPESGTWSGDEDDEAQVSTPRGSLRPAKSVTFQTAPPVINEYEQRTPEPSSVTSGSREGSYDSDEFQDNSFGNDSADLEDSFDASLEDTDKTPVVLPGDWQDASPETARTQLVNEDDDVFSDTAPGSPDPSATPSKMSRDNLASMRSESVTSDGSTRPLPPIPGLTSPGRGRRSSGSLFAAAERASSVQRNLPSPPRPASISKDEILRMREANMTLEDRMGLLALQEEQRKTSASQVTEVEVQASVDEEDAVGDLPDFDTAPTISRESILRGIKSDLNNDDFDDGRKDTESLYSEADVDYSELAKVDPDVAIPSRETSTQFEQLEFVNVKEEQDDSNLDLQDIPAVAYSLNQMNLAPSGSEERQSSILHNQQARLSTEESASQYSESPANQGMQTMQGAGLGISNEETFSTPMEEPIKKELPKDISLPLLSNFLGADDFDFGLKKYMTPPDLSIDTAKAAALDVNGPEMEPVSPISTEVDSIAASSAPVSRDGMSFQESEELPLHALIETPAIPERRATIKTGGKLKARPSGTPADYEAMFAAQAAAGADMPVPAIPGQYRDEAQEQADNESVWSQPSAAESGESKNDSAVEQDTYSRKPQLDLKLPNSESNSSSDFNLGQELERVMEGSKVRNSLNLQSIDFATAQHCNQLTFAYTHPKKPSQDSPDAVERFAMSPLMPPLPTRQNTNRGLRRQKGYLMRQNTKVVVASNRNMSDESADSNATVTDKRTSNAGPSAPSSPRKASNGEKFIKTEPWNGKMRRKSSRKSSGGHKGAFGGTAPPLPGQESALGVVDEYSVLDDQDEETERGRLFVKVVGVKDLDLPLPRNDRLFFQLTLDNGLHCVTTADLNLGRSASIGQEFELVVLQDLDFQLTLTTKLPPAPKPQSSYSIAAPVSPTKAPRSPTKSVFSRLLSSPKKRAEKERLVRLEQEAEEAERRRQEDEQRKRASLKTATPWDKLRELVDAQTGSFARSYLSLKSYEGECFGRQLTVDVPLFNEWAIEKDAHVVSSVRSKRGNGMSTVRRPPYTIGNLEVQLLYIPKPRDATEDSMPKSMSGAVREIAAAEKIKETKHEGCLSQQGGDCPYWRRRFFRLSGTRLTAYHEATMQPRATINLSKASRLIDDKSSLVADPHTSGAAAASASASPKKRRKSAFAEEDEGYQFVEEGFRLRFANGETIDFYADDRAAKDRWMEALSQAVGRPGSSDGSSVGSKVAKWTDLVLEKERLGADKEKVAAKTASRPKSADDDAASIATTEKMQNPEICVQAPSRENSKASTIGGSSFGYSQTAPNSPVKRDSVVRKEIGGAPAVPSKDADAVSSPVMSPRVGHRERKAVKSMIF